MKLLHPDRHTDPRLRQAAEAQMRRINAMVDLLLDPDRRRHYDQELVQPPQHWRAATTQRSALGLLLVAAAALVLTLAGWRFLAGNWVRVDRAAPAVRPEMVKASPRPNSPSTATTSGNTVAPESRPSRRSTGSGGRPARDAALPAAQAMEVPPSLPPSLPTVPPALAYVPAVPPPDSGLVGFWVYQPSSSPRAAIALYAPEFIELRLQQSANLLMGQYVSRYYVLDRAISPAVSFTFQGPSNDPTFPWMAEDGTRGTVDLRLLGPERLQVDWRVREFGSRVGLGAGTAVLTRRREPQ